MPNTISTHDLNHDLPTLIQLNSKMPVLTRKNIYTSNYQDFISSTMTALLMDSRKPRRSQIVDSDGVRRLVTLIPFNFVSDYPETLLYSSSVYHTPLISSENGKTLEDVEL